MRLNRYLAGAGFGSRRACEELIRQGRIEVNGAVAPFPGPEIDPGRDRVLCDGERVRLPQRWIYLVLHKPPGYVTTLDDERGRACVSDLLGSLRGKVFPIGRLDRSSEGLLLLTNNGALAQRLLHPRYHQERTYLVWLRPVPSVEQLKEISQGVWLGPRERSGPAKVRLLGRRGDIGRVRISLTEGKNREVRRIFAKFGCVVMTLRRMSYAGILLTGLAVGAWRHLDQAEVASLAERTGLDL